MTYYLCLLQEFLRSSDKIVPRLRDFPDMDATNGPEDTEALKSTSSFLIYVHVRACIHVKNPLKSQ